MPRQQARRLRDLARRARSASRDGRLRALLTGRPVTAGLDSWLVPFFDAELSTIDRSLKSPGADGYRLFRELDDDLWSLLLTKEYGCYPRIRRFLPGHPEPAMQVKWNGASGLTLAAQSVSFYRKLKQVQERHGNRDLADARVLDYGCGWGRLTRMIARDVDLSNLHGCDPVEEVLAVCRETRVPGRLARNDFLPERLPVAEPLDFVFSFSVFTHISEAAARSSVAAIADALAPGGLFTFTVRPAAYLDLNPLMKPLLDQLGDAREQVLGGPAYLFAAHHEEGHSQFDGNEMSYGETVITIPWIRENWTDRFELVDLSVLTGDMYQVAVTLKKR